MNLRSKKARTIGYLIIIVVLLSVVVAALVRANRASISPEGVVERFYRGWIQANDEPGSALAANLHLRSTYASESLARYVDRNTEYDESGALTFDPIVCGLTARAEPELNTVSESSERARTIITGVAEGPINVYTIKGEDGWWYVDEVECP